MRGDTRRAGGVRRERKRQRHGERGRRQGTGKEADTVPVGSEDGFPGPVTGPAADLGRLD